MSVEESDCPKNTSEARLSNSSQILWILLKDPKRLRCELRHDSRTNGWEMQIFDDGELCFEQRWPLEATARFFAASLRRERMRNGWSEVPVTVGVCGASVSVEEKLAFVVRHNCPYALEFMSNLNDALNVLGWPTEYQFINADALPSTDARRGYPSPTLLWKGLEIFGLPVPTPPFQSC